MATTIPTPSCHDVYHEMERRRLQDLLNHEKDKVSKLKNIIDKKIESKKPTTGSYFLVYTIFCLAAVGAFNLSCTAFRYLAHFI